MICQKQELLIDINIALSSQLPASILWLFAVR
jgi:hypothetical protein